MTRTASERNVRGVGVAGSALRPVTVRGPAYVWDGWLAGDSPLPYTWDGRLAG